MENKEENKQLVEETKQTNSQLQYDEVQVKKEVERTDSYFDGKVLELIGYRILSFLITVFTLGLASAWGEKLLIAYKVEHTIYNGKRLKFEGTGASLFVQRFKWIFFTIITLGIYSFWIPIKKEKWIVSNIHFEKEEFAKGDSYFDGKLLPLIGVNLFCRILTTISLGILFPFGICYKQKWMTKHTIINRKRIVFEGRALSLIGHYLIWWFLCIITFGIYGFWLPIKIENWKAKNTHIKLKDETEQNLSVAPAILGIILAIVLVIVGVSFTCKYINNLNVNGKFDFEEIFYNIEKNFEGSSKNGKYNVGGSIATIPLNEEKNNNNKEQSNGKKNNEEHYYRQTSITLIDGVACYGYSTHEQDLTAEIDNGNIAICQSMGAVLIENANAKYLYSVSKYSADDVDLYFITKKNELYVIHNPNANEYNQKKVKVTNSSVTEFLGTTIKDDGAYIKVLLSNGETEEFLYQKYNQL